MSKVLIIGAGGVGRVVAYKCAQHRDIFGDILLASRTKKKCDAIADAIYKAYGGRKIKTAKLDADNVEQTVALIRKFQPDLVINVALPYQDLPIMDACLETGTHYMLNHQSFRTPRSRSRRTSSITSSLWILRSW
jgi:saccharopine dehydrogenase (NAD+, L-lysine-forming)